MDPRMPDSDLDGIDDGSEDFDDDGLNRSHLLNRIARVGTIHRMLNVTLTRLPIRANVL